MMLNLAVLCSGLLAALPGELPTADDDKAYQAAAATVPHDADAHVRLASWCEAHRLEDDRYRHLAIALKIAPDHAAAHGLLGLMADNGEWRMPQAVAARRRGDAQAAATLANYHARRDKIADTAEAHRQLAEWCDQNGLKAEAVVHWTAVVRLNPAREDAWKKLGYRQQKGRWTTAELTAAEHAGAEARRKADARWRPLLSKWSIALNRKTKRADALAALAQVHDPRAVPSIWKVLMAGGPVDQAQAVALLRQIDAPSASRALTSLAVAGASDEIRLAAAEALLRRDPREFATLLIGLLRDPIKYEVREVKGPGQPGELYVHGEKANHRFFYQAPPALATLRPTDIVGFDYDGLPVATRVVGFAYTPIAAEIDPRLGGAPDLTGAPQILAGARLGAAGFRLGQQMVANQQAAAAAGLAMDTVGMGIPGISNQPLAPPNRPNSGQINNFGRTLADAGLGPIVPMPVMAPVPVGRLMVAAQRQAEFSRARLQEDVAALDRYNKDVNQINDRAKAALEIAINHKLGPERKAWVKWWTDLMETSTAVAPLKRDGDRESKSNQIAIAPRAMAPSFGAETLLWTLSGFQPVEAIRAGDQVLTQDTTTGALAFFPVLTIHHFERQPAKTVVFQDASIVATDLERFWAAGKGWVMAVDLKPGDAVRAMGGVVKVAVVEDAEARPSFNVQIAPGRGIIVGERGILAHDERLAYPAAAVFDAMADVKAPRLDR